MYVIEERMDVPVIRATNLLPDSIVDEFFALLDELQHDFASPAWSTGSEETPIDAERKRSLCSAEDIWLPALRGSRLHSESDAAEKRPYVPELLYDLIENFMLHRGIVDFCRNAQQQVFRLIPNQDIDGKVHIVSYGDGGYYNWHCDHSLAGGAFLYGNSAPRNVLFTFSLSLCRNEKMEGGDLLFMNDGRTICEPFEHNSMSIFPCTVNHAATVVRSHGNDDWLDRRISCQFWMAGTQILPRKRSGLRWSGPR